MNKLNINQELDIIEKRKNNISLDDLKKEFNIKSDKTIYDIHKRNGREHLIPNKKYDCNSDYFKEINSEDKAYWLGFLYADGYVRMKDNRSGELKLKLKKSDREHIELFNKYLSSNYPIKDLISKVKVDDKIYVSECSSLSIYNTKLVKDLFNHGCLNNKTFKIKIPDLKNNMIRHFIRGYFDGDGCIYKHPNGSSAECNITSNLDFITNIFNYLKYGRIIKHGKVFGLRFYHKKNIEKFYHLIYEESTIFLKRKKDIFDKHLKLI